MLLCLVRLAAGRVPGGRTTGDATEKLPRARGRLVAVQAALDIILATARPGLPVAAIGPLPGGLVGRPP